VDLKSFLKREKNMTWVKTFDEKETACRLAEVYAEVMNSTLDGRRILRVPGIMRCMGLRPEALLSVWRLNHGITFGLRP
jgi:hypothetical protein